MTARRLLTTLIVIVANVIALIAIDRVFGHFFPGHAHRPDFDMEDYGHDSYPTDPRDYFRSQHLIKGLTVHYLDRQNERRERLAGTAAADDRLRMVAVGDSFTFGQGVYLEDTYVMRLDGRSAGSTTIEAVNLGESGADVLRVRDIAREKLPAFDPDVVVYGYCLNDPVIEVSGDHLQWFEDARPGKVLWDLMNLRIRFVAEKRSHTSAWLARNSGIYDYFLSLRERARISAHTIQVYQTIHDPVLNEPGLAKTVAAIRDMQCAAEKAGARFVVLVLPIFFHVGDEDYPLRAAHETLEQQLRAAKIDVIDLSRSYRGYDDEDLWVHAIDQHPGPRAHEIASDRLFEWIATQEPAAGSKTKSPEGSRCAVDASSQGVGASSPGRE